MSESIKTIISWLLVAAWMMLIFTMSAQVSAESNRESVGVSRIIASIFVRGWNDMTDAEQAEIVESIHVLVRKTAHFTLYLILGVLSFNAVSNHVKRILPAAGLAFAISALYSVTDEIHQLFTVGRSCEIRDMLIDSTGAIVGILIISAAKRVLRRNAKCKMQNAK